MDNSGENSVETASRASAPKEAGPADETGLRPAVPDGESLIRRRFAATCIDLLLLCTGAYLMWQARWTFVLFAFAVFLMRDWAEGYSPGKRLFGLAAFGPHGRRCTLAASALRNITLLPPFLFVEMAIVLFSKRRLRLGDILGGTAVRRRQPAQAANAEWPEADPATAQLGGPNETDAEIPDDLSATESFDSMIIDVLPAARETLTSEEPLPPAGTEEGAPSADRQQDELAASSIEPGLAAACIGIEGEVTEESLDDAYWEYVERYSPDAAGELSDDQLPALCAEIASAKAGLPIPVPDPLPENPARSDCLQYLNEWFVVINRCRDALS